MTFFTRTTLLATLVFLPLTAQAAASIKSPIVTKGETEVEFQSFGTSDGNSDKDGEHNLRSSIGYGVTNHWFAEIESEWSNNPHASFTHEAVALENTFQILPQGEYKIDLGFYAEYELGTRAHSADGITLGPIFQTDIGKLRLTANPFLSFEVGSHGHEAPGLNYGLQAQYMLHNAFAPAIEFYGKTGSFMDDTSLNDQDQKLGPVLTGKFSAATLGLPGKFGYEAGVLFGVTDVTAARTYKGKLEYEFAF